MISKRRLLSLFVIAAMGAACAIGGACAKDNVQEGQNNGGGNDVGGDGGDVTQQTYPGAVKLEAENAVVTGECTGGAFIVNMQGSSGGKHISNIAAVGNTINWYYNATGEISGTLYLSVANASSYRPGFSFGNGKVAKLYVGATDKATDEMSEIALPQTELPMGTSEVSWQTVKVENVSLPAGLNKITLEIIDAANAVRVDYIGFDVADTNALTEHTHAWETNETEPDCTTDGGITRDCDECGAHDVVEKVPALGHKFGERYLNPVDKTMDAECERCHFIDSIPIETDKNWMGETYNADRFAGLESTLGTKLVYEAELAQVAYADPSDPDAVPEEPHYNNGNSYIERVDKASGGKSVGNISNYGNFVKFRLNAENQTTASLAFVVANTRLVYGQIAQIDNLGEYISVTIDGEEVELGYCTLPGSTENDYFNWNYIVIQGISLGAGEHEVVISPKNVMNGDSPAASMPNLDCLNIYTQNGEISLIKNYVYTATAGGTVNRFYTKTVSMQRAEGENSFSAELAQNTTADISVTLGSASGLLDATLLLNDRPVGISGDTSSGPVTLVISGVPLNSGNNVFEWTSSAQLDITDVTIHVVGDLVASVDNAYDAYDNPAAGNHKLTYEVEDPSVYRDGGTIVSGTDVPDTASGDACLDSFKENGGSYIRWKFTSDKQALADIVVRLACANWSSEVNGNTPMENLADFMELYINGRAADLSAVGLTNAKGWHNFEAVVIKNAILLEGENTVELRAKEGSFPNVDCMYVFSTEQVSLERNPVYSSAIDNSYDAMTNNDTQTPSFTAEAEDALITNADGSVADGGKYNVDVNSNFNNASGGESIGNFSGDNGPVMVTFTVNASAEAEGKVVLRLASGLWQGGIWGGQGGCADMELYKFVRITVNGVDVSLYGIVLPNAGEGGDPYNYWVYQAVVIDGVQFKEGENTVVIERLDNQSVPNMDCMYIYSQTDGVSFS